MSEISRTTVETRRYSKPIPDTVIEPKGRVLAFTARAVVVSQKVIDGKPGEVYVTLEGGRTKKNGEPALYRERDFLNVTGYSTWQIRNDFTDEAQAVAAQLAREALSEFEAIDWDAQTVAP